MLLAATLDRATKIWVVGSLPFETPVTVIPGLERIFTFTYIHNTGAAFGMLPQLGSVFAVVAVVVALGLMVWYQHLPVQHLLVRIAVGLVAGGALGNFVDRVRTGYVVDFLHFHFWPIFNVADSSVFVGVIILGAYMLLAEEAAEKAAPRRDSLERSQPDA